LPVLLGVIVIAAVVVGGLFALKGGDFAKLEPFPASSFLEGPSDFLGNRYKLQAQIDAQLRWDRNVGRLLAVVPNGADTRLPVFVPADAARNLHVGQRYEMRVRVEEGGLIYVENLRKF